VLFEGIVKEPELVSAIDSGAFLLQGFYFSEANENILRSDKYKNIVPIHRRMSMDKSIQFQKEADRAEIVLSQIIQKNLPAPEKFNFDEQNPSYYDNVDSILKKLLQKLPPVPCGFIFVTRKGTSFPPMWRKTRGKSLP